MWAGSNLSFGNTHKHTHTPCSVIPVRALNYLCHDHGECCQASHSSEYIRLHYPTTHGVAPWGDMLPLDSQIFDFIKWRYLTPWGWIQPCVSTIRITDTWTPLPLKSITIFWIQYLERPKYQQKMQMEFSLLLDNQRFCKKWNRGDRLHRIACGNVRAILANNNKKMRR